MWIGTAFFAAVALYGVWFFSGETPLSPAVVIKPESAEFNIDIADRLSRTAEMQAAYEAMRIHYERFESPHNFTVVLFWKSQSINAEAVYSRAQDMLDGALHQLPIKARLFPDHLTELGEHTRLTAVLEVSVNEARW